MNFLWLILFVAAGFIWFWISERLAAERASELGRQACGYAGAQWLDQSVHLIGRRLARNDSGRLGWERRFGFEYSIDGNDRHRGMLILQGARLVGMLGPERGSADSGNTSAPSL